MFELSGIVGMSCGGDTGDGDGGGVVNAEQESRALERQAILQRSATFTVTGKKRFFSVPQILMVTCV